MTVNGVDVDPMARIGVPVTIESANNSAGTSTANPMLVRDVDRASEPRPAPAPSAAAATAAAPVTPAANDNPPAFVSAFNLDTPLVDTAALNEQVNQLIATLPRITLEPVKAKFEDFWNFANRASQPLLRTLRSLGPGGEAQAEAVVGMQQLGASMLRGIEGINNSAANYQAKVDQTNKALEAQGSAQRVVADEGEQQASRLAAGFSAAAAVIGGVISILESASKAKIAGIDKEIAAEQKRDGKSAASLAKIDSMEKKKDSIARKQFNTNKKLMLAQAVMATAAGIAGVLGDPSLPTFAKPIFAGIIGAMGLAQVAIIAGTQYESSYTPKSISTPSSLSIGKRGDSVNLAGGPNANAGGEIGYLRGAQGTGTNASNYNRVGSAYGGDLMRGYGNRGFIVGEKGPEVINPETPISVTPANDVNSAQPINASFSIQALDASDVKKVLVDNRGNIIQMLREAANNSGQGFMEDVNVNVYTRPNIGKL
jgi:hypothetical protein